MSVFLRLISFEAFGGIEVHKPGVLPFVKFETE